MNTFTFSAEDVRRINTQLMSSRAKPVALRGHEARYADIGIRVTRHMPALTEQEINQAWALARWQLAV